MNCKSSSLLLAHEHVAPLPVAADDMSKLHEAICAKFELPDTSKLRLYLTEDKIEVRVWH
jgi:hypothetical protein